MKAVEVFYIICWISYDRLLHTLLWAELLIIDVEVGENEQETGLRFNLPGDASERLAVSI